GLGGGAAVRGELSRDEHMVPVAFLVAGDGGAFLPVLSAAAGGAGSAPRTCDGDRAGARGGAVAGDRPDVSRDRGHAAESVGANGHGVRRAAVGVRFGAAVSRRAVAAAPAALAQSARVLAVACGIRRARTDD